MYINMLMAPWTEIHMPKAHVYGHQKPVYAPVSFPCAGAPPVNGPGYYNWRIRRRPISRSRPIATAPVLDGHRARRRFAGARAPLICFLHAAKCVPDGQLPFLGCTRLAGQHAMWLFLCSSTQTAHKSCSALSSQEKAPWIMQYVHPRQCLWI